MNRPRKLVTPAKPGEILVAHRAPIVPADALPEKTPVLRYGKGLLWALSSTGDVFTAVGSGAAGLVQAKLGS